MALTHAVIVRQRRVGGGDAEDFGDEVCDDGLNPAGRVGDLAFQVRSDHVVGDAMYHGDAANRVGTGRKEGGGRVE